MRDFRLKLMDGVGLKGRVLVQVADASSLAAAKMVARINAAIKQGKDKVVRALLAEYHARFLVDSFVRENTIPTAGLTLLAQLVSNNISDINDVIGNYGAAGSSSTAFTSGSTTLNAEFFRKLFASRSYASNKAYFTAFYDTDDFNNTVKEHGVFLEGTASANTGNPLSLIVLNGTTGVAKDGTQTLTIEHEITFSEV